MKKKALEKLYGKKRAEIITLALLILVMSVFCLEIPKVRATVGSNHSFYANYYRAYVSDDHEVFGNGEWYFYLTAATGAYTQTGERSVGDHEYENFDLMLNWLIGASTHFVCFAGEQDITYDYTSSVTVDVAFPGTTLNAWVSGSRVVGDVTHYYRWLVNNRNPVLGSLTGPSSGYHEVAYQYATSATDLDGDSVTYEWRVDGVPRSITGSSLIVQFASTAAPGDHTISVRAKDALGAYSGWKDTTFTLLGNRAPTVSTLSGPASGYRGNAVTMTATATDPDLDSLTYEWMFDSTTQPGTTGSSFTFTIGTSPSLVGDHIIKVRAKDAHGAYSDWVNKDFEIINYAPTVTHLDGPTSGYRGTAYAWTATGSDNDGDALTYEWYVDGTYRSGGSSLTYTFGSGDATGAHTIRVRVRDAVGDYSGYSTLTFTLNVTPKVATPTFSPAAGTYSSSQSVTISCSTSGATIRYTTDGSSPSSTSAVYSGPIEVSSTTTIKAKAFKSGMTDSDTASATYTINTPVEMRELTLSLIGSGSIDPAPGVYTYDNGTEVPVLATPSTNWVLDHWVLDGTVIVETNPVVITMGRDREVLAVFIRMPPTAGSCDQTGTGKDRFNSTESIYVNGVGYGQLAGVDVYVVNDVAWTDGMAIPARVSGTVAEVVSDMSGEIVPTVVWAPPLVEGEYDVCFDANGNGVYDASIDALDDNEVEVSAGFVIPELSSWLALLLFLVAATSVVGFTRTRVRTPGKSFH